MQNVVAVADVVGIGEVASTCVVVWRGAVTPGPFTQQRDALARVVERHPGEAGFLCVIEPSSKPPDDILRKESARMIADHGARLKCCAMVIEGSGFKAAVIRTVLTGISLLAANRQSQVAYFSNVSAGAQWLAGLLHTATADDFVGAVGELRAGLKPAQG